jgi:hypothetical protein
MTYCEQCGTAATDGARFCGSCGLELGGPLPNRAHHEAGVAADTGRASGVSVAVPPTLAGALAYRLEVAGVPCVRRGTDITVPEDMHEQAMGILGELIRTTRITTPAATSTVRQAPTSLPKRPVGPAQRQARSSRGNAGVVAGAAVLTAARLIWGLIVGVVAILVIVGYLWGGSNQAHLDCLAHRFGADNSIVDQVACTVEH